ncbi:hypothetical protein SAMN05444166_3389 [Singulisphaera sp. GP187]|nr:hypothetical protein SAMN05444166_3389 [Singulisphaera sp. GP187]
MQENVWPLICREQGQKESKEMNARPFGATVRVYWGIENSRPGGTSSSQQEESEARQLEKARQEAWAIRPDSRLGAHFCQVSQISQLKCLAARLLFLEDLEPVQPPGPSGGNP